MCVPRVVCVVLALCTASTSALAQTPAGAPAKGPAPASAPGTAPRPAYSTPPPRPGRYPPPAYTTAPPPYRAWYPPPRYTPPPPPPSPAHRRKVANAHADRVLVAPTAYTHPAGSFYATSYDIALLQLGYAVSDSTQISVTGTPPLGADHIFPLDFSLKTRLLDDRRVRIAAIASVTGIAGTDQGNLFLGRGGGVVQLCFDDACQGSFSLGSTLLLAGPVSLVASGAGAIVPVAHWLHLLFEADTLLPIGREAGPYNGVAVGGGARFPFKNWAIDLGALRALDTTSSSATVPMLVVTYRYVP